MLGQGSGLPCPSYMEGLVIFYFSGQIPMSRKKSEDDEDILFFQNKAGTYDRLICLIYEKEANQTMENLQLVENKHGNGKRKRGRRRS